MSQLFISHSSANNAEAIAMRDWLAEEGWGDIFLDLDPAQGLAPGQRWREELKKAGERCSAVVVLVSPEWVASKWCLTEFLFAAQLGKEIFPVLIKPCPVNDLPIELKSTYQFADISTPEREAEGYARLSVGLHRAGLQPGSFRWPPEDQPNRKIYRGLRVLEEVDAAIYFGRDTQITKALDALRQMRDGTPERMLVILGASGAGKSSFLRAGLLSRLNRDVERYLVLPPLRPGRAAMSGSTGLLKTLSLTEKLSGDALAAHLESLRAPAIDSLSLLRSEYSQSSDLSPPTIVVPIDQAEELLVAGAEEAAEAIEQIADLVAVDRNVLLLMTIRSDSFELLQGHDRLSAIARRPFDLPRLTPASFKEIIEGPTRLRDVELLIESELTDQLIKDFDGRDALPLLAFTLQRLLIDHGDDNRLELHEYVDDMRGVGGAIRSAVSQAFAKASELPALPNQRTDLDDLACRCFVPWLVRLDDVAAVPKRRIALRHELPKEGLPLINCLTDQRLLVSDNDSIEVAHEAVLREWPELKTWIADRREDLASLERVTAEANEWQNTDVNRKEEVLNLRGERLDDAEDLLAWEDLAWKEDDFRRRYIEACRALVDKKAQREQNRQNQLKRWLLVASILLVVAIGAAGWAWFAAEEAKQNAVLAQRNELSANLYAARAFEEKALKAIAKAEEGKSSSDCQDAWLYLLQAAKQVVPQNEAGLQTSTIAQSTPSLLFSAFAESWVSPVFSLGVSFTAVSFSPDGRTVISGSEDGAVRLWDKNSGKMLQTLEGHSGAVYSVAFSPDGRTVISGSRDRTLRLWNASSGKILETFEGHQGAVQSVAFSPDGRMIISGSDDGTLRLWHVASGKALRIFDGHNDGLDAVSFSPNGRTLVSGSRDSTVRLWDIASGETLQTSAERDGLVTSVSFSPDGRIVARGTWDGSLRLWDVASGKSLRTFKGHDGEVSAVAFSPDGRTLVSGTWEGSLQVWDVASGEALQTFEGHRGSVAAVAFSPDGRTVVSGSPDQTLRLWDVSSGKTLQTFEGHRNSVTAVAIGPDGRTVVSGSADLTMRLWDVVSGKVLKTLEGHRGSVKAAAFSPDGRTIVSGSGDNTLRLWDVASGKMLKTLEGHRGSVAAVAFSPDGWTVVSGSDDGTLRQWEVTSGKILETFEGHGGAVHSVSFSPDGEMVVSGWDDGTLRLWNASSGKILEIFEGNGVAAHSVAFSPDGRMLISGSYDGSLRMWDMASGNFLRIFEGHDGLITSVAFSPDGRTLVSGSYDSALRLWDTDSGEMLRTFKGNGGQVLSVAFSPDGTTVFSGSGDGALRMWDVARRKTLRTFKGHSERVNSVAFSPDGRSLVSGSNDESLRLWDVASGKTLQTFEGHGGRVRSVAFSPSGRMVISGSDDNTLRLWDVASGRMLSTLAGHSAEVTAVAFSPDGRTVVSGSNDSALRLWEVSSGRILHTLEGQSGPFTAVAFSPDGRTVVSGSHDRTLRLWDVASGRLLKIFEGHGRAVFSVAFSPDGQTVVSGSADYTMRLWDVASGRTLRIFDGPHSWVTAVVYSPDGRTIFSSMDDDVLRLWDVASGTVLQTIEGDGGRVNAVAFSPDGRTVVSGSEHGTLQLWDIQVSALLVGLAQDQRLASKMLEALNFLWKRGLNVIDVGQKLPTPDLYGVNGYFYAEAAKYQMLLKPPRQGETKLDQVMRWARREAKKTAVQQHLEGWPNRCCLL